VKILVKICSVVGCDKERHAKGFCHMHYIRFKKHNDPLYVETSEKREKRYKKLHESHKGHIPLNKGKKGVTPEPWNKGKKNVYTKKQLERISKATKNAMARPEVREKMEKAGKMFKKGETKTGQGTKQFKKGQIPHNKGVKASEELKKKFSIAQQKRFANMSEEERKKMSIAAKKGWANMSEEAREAARKKMLGKKHTLETRKNMSISQTKRTDRLRPEYRKKLALARRNVKIPKKDTKPEKFLQKLLRENNIIFETHKAILGQPDIFIKPNFCIFVDGDRYHANPKKYSDDKIIWNEYNRKGRHIPAQTAKMIREKDKRITDNLKKEGFKVIRFWQSELEEETEKCLKKILKFTKS
jgi:DNA mismatch endonuclease (patch repair protein)